MLTNRLFNNLIKLKPSFLIRFNSNSKLTFEYVSNETLESLNDKFDELSDDYSNKLSNEYDVNYSNGVLTIKLDSKYGTYVINKQTPNLQIWLSSPLSGPKRYDFINNKWIYKHDGESLHSLLTREISNYLKEDINFNDCAFATGEAKH